MMLRLTILAVLRFIAISEARKTHDKWQSPMYRPDHFRVDDLTQMHALMRERPFAALVSMGSEGLSATHLPTVLKDEGPDGVVEYHLARANPHWKELAEGNEALMIFRGPEGYITPNWYPSKIEHQKVVPTWNYAVVHAHGRPEAVQDKDWLRRHVAELTEQQEIKGSKQAVDGH
jgi:transcriptional regulator